MAASSGQQGAPSGTFLVSGGQVGLEHLATAIVVSSRYYYIDGTQHTSPQATVTLTGANATLDRIDAFIVNTSSVATKVDGTAANPPVEPNTDPATQLQLAFAFVTHNTTAPPSTTATLVYDEDTGPAAEYTWTSSGSTWNLASTNFPFHGTKDIEATTISSAAYILGTIQSGTVDPTAYSFLTFYLRSKAGWGNKTMQLRLLSATGVVLGKPSQSARVCMGSIRPTRSSYQQIAIPVGNFGLNAGALSRRSS